MPRKPHGSRVAFTFDCVGIAEEELKAAKLPKDQDSRVFRAGCPSPPLCDKGIGLYRAHIRELIERAREGADLRPATDAELLAVVSETSLIAPLSAGAVATAAYLFERVFPDQADAVFGSGNDRPRASWPGQVSEYLTDMRRKFRVEERG